MMLIAILAGFALALFAPILHRFTHRFTGWLIALLPAALFIYFAGYVDRVAEGEIIHQITPWILTYNINLSFVLDGLSLLMALIITGVGALICIYGGGYLHGHPYEGRFYSFLLIFMAAMLGLVLSDNLLVLFMFWELTSISSYLLIGYQHDAADSRSAALKALFVTGTGGLAMLAGFILLGDVAGTLEISALAAQGETIRHSQLYGPILGLIALGAFTKSAQFPFHFWLPGAMAAPTPVSAYLHSATMVKAGIFLLARLSPTLSGTDEWRGLLTMVGVITMLMGGFLSLKQSDLKRILAYSTVSSLGVLVALLGWNTKVALEAAVLFLLVHSLYKGALFMVAGVIDHETGTRDIHTLGGQWRMMPLTALGALLAVLSMGGIPPLVGFIGKELIYESTLGYAPDSPLNLDNLAILLTLAALLTNIAAIGVGCLVFLKPFLGPQKETPKHPHAAPVSLWIGPVLLGIMALMLGLWPDFISRFLIGPAASAVYGSPVDLHLHLIPRSLTPMLILSLITVAGGALLYIILNRLTPLLNRLDLGKKIGPERLFQATVDGLPQFAKQVTLLFQSGYLRGYIAWVVGGMVVLVGYPLLSQVGLPRLSGLDDVRLYELILVIVILMALTMVVSSSSLLFTIPAMGVIGYSIALIFILYGAPDLAMTQFSVETLSVVLFVLVLYRLPELAQLSSRAARLRDGVIALAAGGLMTTLILILSGRPLESPLTAYFAESSYPLAQGRNIVNVILVDFRGFDTMGEITVLSIAALGIYALLKLRANEEAPDDTEAYENMVSVQDHAEIQKGQDS